MCPKVMCETRRASRKMPFVILLHSAFFKLDIGKTFGKVKKLEIQELTWKRQVLIILANANRLI